MGVRVHPDGNGRDRHGTSREPATNDTGRSATGALEFIQRHGDLLLGKVIEAHPPVYDGTVPETVSRHVKRLRRRLFPAQVHAVAALWARLQETRPVDAGHPGGRHEDGQSTSHPGGSNGDGRSTSQEAHVQGDDAPFVGEMGVGKTLCSLAASYVYIQEQRQGSGRILVLCPTHLLKKWGQEAKSTFPVCETRILRTIPDVDRAFAGATHGIQVLLLSKEMAKLGMPRKPAFAKLSHKRSLACPQCGTEGVVYEDPRKRTDGEIKAEPPRPDSKKLPFCAKCAEPLWTWRRLPGGKGRYPLADYIARRRFTVDVFLADESHQFKGSNTAQGSSFYRLVKQSRKVLLLTGTIVNGYSSSLFYLLYRTAPEVSKDFRFNEEERWVENFGYRDRIIKHDDPEGGVVTRKHKQKEAVRERPGISPLVFKYLLGRTVFLSLRDVAEALPPFEEIPIPVKMEGKQKDLYKGIEAAFKSMHGADKDPRTLSTFLQVLLSWPDNPWRSETILNREDEPVYRVPALPKPGAKALLPKEKELLEIIRSEVEKHRKVFLFATFTGTRDIQPRLQQVLLDAGFRVAVLRSDTVTAEDRMDWIAAATPRVDVIVSQPRNVEVGLDLIEFPTLIYYQSEYSLYTLRQSSRRSWRIGQREPVRVYYLYYSHSAQEKATVLAARKLAAALLIDGESIPEHGLAAGDTGNLLSELSQALMRETQLPDIRELFAKTRIERPVQDPVMEEASLPVSPDTTADMGAPHENSAQKDEKQSGTEVTPSHEVRPVRAEETPIVSQPGAGTKPIQPDRAGPRRKADPRQLGLF